MISYIFRRILTAIPTCLIMIIGYLSWSSLMILTCYVQQLRPRPVRRGNGCILRQRYNMDDPSYIRFSNWFLIFRVSLGILSAGDAR
jgi:ABC-type dipeptide/oligopeptide/nickel transport system permease component